MSKETRTSTTGTPTQNQLDEAEARRRADAGLPLETPAERTVRLEHESNPRATTPMTAKERAAADAARQRSARQPETQAQVRAQRDRDAEERRRLDSPADPNAKPTGSQPSESDAARQLQINRRHSDEAEAKRRRDASLPLETVAERNARYQRTGR